MIRNTIMIPVAIIFVVLFIIGIFASGCDSGNTSEPTAIQRLYETAPGIDKSFEDFRTTTHATLSIYWEDWGEKFCESIEKISDAKAYDLFGAYSKALGAESVDSGSLVFKEAVGMLFKEECKTLLEQAKR